MILRKEKDLIQLSDHFDYKRLLRYCFPSMTMVVFTSIYGVVDGLFVSNFVGKNAFAAINIVMPALMILGALGLMFGSGGTALVAKTLLPIIFGVNGIWGAVAVAEVASCILSWAFLFTQNKKYHYLISK